MADAKEHLLGLSAYLEGQMDLFQQIFAVQERLLPLLETSMDMAPVLELLSQKNALLDQVNSRNHSSSHLRESWKTLKNSLPKELKEAFEAKISNLEELASTIHIHDELLLKKFETWSAPAKPKDRQKQSRNVMNAYRALR